MASGENENFWYLHSQGRRFGPLSEDDLRGYFRAGMVKSVDQISVPGQSATLPAAAVAAMLGESAPVGPPPPETPSPALASAASMAPRPKLAGEPAVLDERAAAAIAAMNIQLESMAANSRRKPSGWLLPVVAGFVLIAVLLVGLNMMRKMSSAGQDEATATEAIPGPVVPGVQSPPAVADGNAAAPAANGEAGLVDWYQMAEGLSGIRDWPALEEHATRWTQAQPERIEAWRSLGMAKSRLGKVEEAEVALNRVLASAPQDNPARILLAEAYVAGQQWKEAGDAYKLLVATQSQNATLWNNYGIVLANLGQGPQAIAALETAVRLDPNFSEAWHNLGLNYQTMGDAGRANAAFAQAKALR